MREVEWRNRARDQLADIYVDTPAEEREELIRIVLQVERELAANAETAGESRGEDQRVYFAPRITVFYELMPGSVVQIFRVRPSKRRWTDTE